MPSSTTEMVTPASASLRTSSATLPPGSTLPMALPSRLPSAWLIRPAIAHDLGQPLRRLQQEPDLARIGLRLPALQFGKQQVVKCRGFEVELQLAVVGLGEPVQVRDESAQSLDFLDDVLGRGVGRVQAVAQPGSLQLDHAERRVQFVRHVVDQLPAQLALRLEGRTHSVEGVAHPAQFVGGRDL